MPGFFIDRPIFAAVIALFVCLGGVLAIPFLPIAQYPVIAPPSISVSTSYPRASPENLYNSVTRLGGAGRDHRQLRARHRSEPRLGRGSEQDQAGRSAPAARRHPTGHPD